MLEPGRRGLTYFVYFSFQTISDDGIASVKQVAINLTSDEKHVDLEFSVSAVPYACNPVTTMK